MTKWEPGDSLPRVDQAPIRVLIIEDNPGDAELIRDQLLDVPNARLSPILAGSLVEARMLLNRVHIEAVILDLDLPDSSGLDTLLALREEQADVPVVVVSGRDGELIRQSALAAGAQEVISKDDVPSRLFALSILYVVERNRAEAHRSQLSRVLEASPDAMLVVGPGGDVRFVNEAAVELFGRSRDDLMAEPMAFSATSGKPVELQIKRSDDERVGELRVVELQWKEGPVALAIIRDVTMEKQLEMQLLLSDRMVSLGTLAAGVAHEVNTPLMSVLLNLDLLGDSIRSIYGGHLGDVERARQELEDARESARQMQQIVGDLRVFSRPEERSFGPMDLERVVESALRMAANQIRHRARVERAFTRVPPVEGNESRLGQVVLNLLVNAAHAVEEANKADPVIRVGTELEQGRVVIVIEDTGCGIPDRVHASIFKPFFTTKPVGKGTGLGLPLSRKIVDDMQGELSFTTKVGEGTTFRVSLPIAERRTFSFPRTESGIGLPAVAASGRLFVIDDDPLMLRALEKRLSRNHKVTSTTEATRALQMLEEGAEVDVILCDLMMPGMTGMEFHAAVEGLENLDERKIVFMTGGAFTDEAQSFLNRVPNKRLDKPLDLEVLERTLQKILRRTPV